MASYVTNFVCFNYKFSGGGCQEFLWYVEKYSNLPFPRWTIPLFYATIDYRRFQISTKRDVGELYSRIASLGLSGVDGYVVWVELSLARGLPSFELVGLPDAAVRESKDRVKAAFASLGFSPGEKRIVVNLAPANTKKTGPVYDLPILLSLVQATGSRSFSTQGMAFIGELALNGEVRPVLGVLPMVLAARQAGLRQVFVPRQNAAEGAVVEGVAVYPVEHVGQLLSHLCGEQPLAPVKPRPAAPPSDTLPDFSEVRGQQKAKRALEVAAAGGHNLLMIGPPGAGKSMLAKRLPGILPGMSFDEAVETTKIHSILGLLESGGLLPSRPFRSPHHTISPAGLVGGGSQPRPGEISLAHNGVLFLDELPEFSKQALEVLRQPMEDGAVTIARASTRLCYPSSFMLVAAMNPCPCGYFGHPSRPCSCGKARVALYLGRVSGPLLDRLDIHVEVAPVEYGQLAAPAGGETSLDIRRRVEQARLLQRQRYEGLGIANNAALTPALLRSHCRLSPQAANLLQAAFERMGLSARSYDRILKLGRTIADLDSAGDIAPEHIAEALQYRSLDRKFWQAGH